jgi:hypothetical protein
MYDYHDHAMTPLCLVILPSPQLAHNKHDRPHEVRVRKVFTLCVKRFYSMR